MTTKTIRVSEATNTQLDWLVAEAREIPQAIIDGAIHDAELVEFGCDSSTLLNYTANWSLMGPIIERERISPTPLTITVGEDTGKREWFAAKEFSKIYCDGSTALVAAARCYVTSKLGETVEVPEELT